MYQEFQGLSKACQWTTTPIPGFQVKNLGFKLNGLLSCRFISFHSIFKSLPSQSASDGDSPNTEDEVLALSLTQQILKWVKHPLPPSPHPLRPTNSWEKEVEECRVIAHPSLTWGTQPSPSYYQLSTTSSPQEGVPRYHSHSALGGRGFSCSIISCQP